MTTEFQDEHGVTRRLTREEVLTYVTVLAGAGNETTGRLIGWAGAMLARHPEQRDELAADVTFAIGPHYCLGAALARLEGRIALEEILGRWPSWDVDWAAATMTQTSTVRGWEKLPLLIGARSDTATGAPGSEAG